MLIKPAAATAGSALESFTANLLSTASPLRQALNYDQGKEITRQAEPTANTGVMVYFCDPQSPLQRGSGQDTNRLIHYYLPKSSDPSLHSKEQQNAIADLLNNRPRANTSLYAPISVYEVTMDKLSQPSSSIQ